MVCNRLKRVEELVVAIAIVCYIQCVCVYVCVCATLFQSPRSLFCAHLIWISCYIMIIIITIIIFFASIIIIIIVLVAQVTFVCLLPNNIFFFLFSFSYAGVRWPRWSLANTLTRQYAIASDNNNNNNDDNQNYP